MPIETPSDRLLLLFVPDLDRGLVCVVLCFGSEWDDSIWSSPPLNNMPLLVLGELMKVLGAIAGEHERMESTWLGHLRRIGLLSTY